MLNLAELAPEPLHVVQRGNALVITGGHLEDMTPAQASWLQDRLQEVMEKHMPRGRITLTPNTPASTAGPEPRGFGGTHPSRPAIPSAHSAAGREVAGSTVGARTEGAPVGLVSGEIS